MHAHALVGDREVDHRMHEVALHEVALQGKDSTSCRNQMTVKDLKPAVTAEYQHTLAGSELVTVKGAGHSISGGQPDRYTALLRAFLLTEPLPKGTD
ncbi:hypothetical protein [Streptomyces sp. ME18-1-4]|uniref:alpha/beta fold hydrolase n=1 Tax=Streptomyces sp. ME18-1-4 TaxID=3028685 RepID=UPI0029A37796|nr:hypothetical protein [Streptomyces sp. ME18-1-4]MDX3241818.1 hypothetical protein [Streptomyces sp. ME18-1-4]